METLNEESKDSQIEYGDSCGFFLLGLSDFLKIYFVCIYLYINMLWSVMWVDVIVSVFV